MEITLDKQTVFQRCPDCDGNFTVVRGSVYDGGQPLGLYLIALHGHSPQGRLAHLAIAVLDQSSPKPCPIAAAMNVIGMPEQFGFSLVNWDASPWRGEEYLGQMLSADEVRDSPHRPTFFHIANHLVKELQEVVAYFAEPGTAPDQIPK
jgi:hypothetical protein